MSNETLLFICGIILAVSAVTVSFIGLKVKSFPGKAMPLVVIWFAIFVVGSTTFAVLHAKDEDADKAKEAKYEEAGEKAEKESGDAAPLGTEGGEGNEEAGEEEAQEAEEGEGHSEEGAEGAGAEESPESAEEGAKEGKPEGAGKKEAGGGEEASGGDPEAGATVFATNCSVCHGEDGHGGAGGPDLRTMPKAKTEAGAIEQVTEGGGGMPPFGDVLSEEEIQNVAAYVVQDVVGGA
ncbi:MAG TPA: cytochrome c [Solirubrobacterales bacterium]|jgi:mono/diheme cytochrome c family protein